MLARNRQNRARNGRQYGGVALTFRKKTSSFREFPLVNPESFEVLACIGKVNGIKGKIFAVTVYAPPNLTPLRAKQLIEFLSDVVNEGKRKFADCSVIIAGDFNHWGMSDLLDEHPDLKEIDYGATRNGRAIDRTFVNFGRSVKESRTLEPLESEEGNVSDHRIAYARAEFPKPESDTVSYSYQEYSEAGARRFLELVEEKDWTFVEEIQGVDAKVEAMQASLQATMDECFPIKTTVRRKDDPPWINDKIIRMIKMRRKIYDREGRSKRWKKLKKKTAKLTRNRAQIYFKKQKDIMTAPDAARSFFKNAKAYNSREKPPDFDVRNLYPGKDDSEVSELLAGHFNAISSEFKGLAPGDIPQAPSLSLPSLSTAQVAKRLTDFRKPKSRVKGDIFPALVNRAAPTLAAPLANIYNLITVSGEWPTIWKTEYVTPIPKKPLPDGPDDLRNISCTQLMSKVYESFVLDWLNSQVKVRTNQFGGMKGSGAEHFLIEMWQQALENLEDPRAATLITSIDYSKAFNRLDFAHCLRALAAKGACRELLAIIGSFLTNRSMMVKVGNTMSTPRKVLGGVPQGSLLGVLLFNICIDDFEAHSRDIQDYSPDGVSGLTDRAPDPPDPMPVPPEPLGRDYRHLPEWRTQLLQVLKYVDDNVIQEKLNFDATPTDGQAMRVKHAIRTQNAVREIVHQAVHRGMKVNSAKTKALLISELKSYLPAAYFLDADGSKIETASSMKILGFEFSAEPNMAAQVRAIQVKFWSRKWILNHLGHNGFSKADLLKVYKAVILPVHDYCSCVYNSSLTLTQANALERLQAQALKAIYGYEHSYRSLLELTGLKTLQARRDYRCDKFAQKCLQSPKFRKWFPLNPVNRPTRNPLPYEEKFARTKRLYNSPLYHMRRRLNGRQA